MSIENLIGQLIEAVNANTEIQKQVVVALNSGVSIGQADAGAAPKRTRRTKAEIEADEAAAKAQQAGETSTGPSYYVLEATKQVFEVPAGGNPPERFSAQVTKEVYEQKKAEFEAKKAEPAATTQETAATEPTATAPAANASAETSTADGVVTYAEVRAKLMELSKLPEHGALAVKTILTKAAPGVANVPGLDGSGFEAAVMAEINALLNPAPAADVDLF